MTLSWVDPYCGKKPGVNNYFLPKKLTPDLYSETGITDSSILRHFTHEGFARKQGGSKRKLKWTNSLARVLFKERKLEENNSSSSINRVIRANKWRGWDKLSLKNFPVFHCNNRDSATDRQYTHFVSALSQNLRSWQESARCLREERTDMMKDWLLLHSKMFSRGYRRDSKGYKKGMFRSTESRLF